MVIVDTGFWLALANRKDTYHKLSKTKLKELDEPLITTWPVLTETCHLLLRRLGPGAQLAFVAALQNGACTIFSLSVDHAKRIHALMTKYTDLPMDLADASLVILAEHIGHGRILTTDCRDFRSYRWKQRRPFQNILGEP